VASKNGSQRTSLVEAIKHGDKRANIPTADAHDFMDPTIQEARKIRYTRDESLDPQLVWRGKYAADGGTSGADNDLVIDAAPIYIQEKVDPCVLVENLRSSTGDLKDDSDLTLFETFDGLDELESIEFYKHDANWSNRMILGDSLQVMSSLSERELLRGKVQMVYIDPPYGIKFGSNWQARVDSRDVKDGKLEDAAREAEQIKAFRDTWELGIHSYLSYLRDRLVAARELLTDSGCCFVQIGDENVHLVRSLMDEVFGSGNFVSQIAFATTSGAGSFAGGTNVLANVLNYIVVYARDIESVKYRQLFRAKVVGGASSSLYTSVLLSDGSTRPLTAREKTGTPLPAGARAFGVDNLTSQTTRIGQTTVFPVSVGGKTVTPTKGGWKTNQSGMERLLNAGRVYAGTGRGLGYIRYVDDFPAAPISNSWNDTFGQGQFGGDKVYVVQTATKVIERCLLMCTDPGALALARQRFMCARYPWYLLADSAEGHAKEQSLVAEVLPRRDFHSDIRQGFVYERVQHITLKSIANNPDIREGMTRNQIDEAIKRHAEFEVLYDRPYENANIVRVTGPFTVESLSPHRSLAFAGDRGKGAPEAGSETEAAKDADAPNFEQSILENLAKAGIQNGRRKERIEFSSFETYAGEYVQAMGERVGDHEGAAPTRVGIAIGPQYGTVSPSFVKRAAREALHADDVDLLCILGFAFDAQVTGVTEGDGVTVEASDEGFANVASVRRLGRIPVLMVRMNVDLLMGEELKKTGAGNLFTVFGEPDIHIQKKSDGLTVELRGVDVYDPTTGEVRSKDTKDIALWMIDTNYNEESFFVRHCYFTGGNDPYKKLKAALKADIDAEAWESLYKTVSRPFPKPETGKIAVKVINDYGDEVMKVFNV
jgi:adenine-specific DNA-methyltransferase